FVVEGALSGLSSLGRDGDKPKLFNVKLLSTPFIKSSRGESSLGVVGFNPLSKTGTSPLLRAPIILVSSCKASNGVVIPSNNPSDTERPISFMFSPIKSVSSLYKPLYL